MSGDQTKQIEPTDHAKHLVTLITNQDVLVHNWIKTLLAIESALAVAFIFLLKDFHAKQNSLPEWFVVTLVLLIPLLGILFTLTIGEFVSRELKWQRWFTDSYSKLSNWDQAVYPYRTKTRAEPDHQTEGFFKVRLVILCRTLALIWLIVGAAASIALLRS